MSAMTEPRRVLAVTDLGPAGAEAVRAAAARARAAGAVLAVVHATPSLEMVRPVFAERVVEDAVRQATLPEQIRLALDRQIAECAPDSGAEIYLDIGGVAGIALATAERWRADLVVVGVSDAGVIEVERIVRHAHVPVLVMRPGAARGAVMACTDFSDSSLPAVHSAAQEAARTGDPLHVVHVLAPLSVAALGIEGYGLALGDGWYAERRREAERWLGEALAEVGGNARGAVIDGLVVSTLVAAARERAARLIVIGTIGRTGVTRFLLGSVAEELVRAAPCSTLVVRLRRD